MPACVFFVASVPMLQERGYPVPLALMTLNQVSEMFFMFTMPLFVVWLGLKRVLALGMFAADNKLNMNLSDYFSSGNLADQLRQIMAEIQVLVRGVNRAQTRN